jgi:predicted metal-dependent peptidase
MAEELNKDGQDLSPVKIENNSSKAQVAKVVSDIILTITGQQKIIKRNSIHDKFKDANIEMLSTGNLPYYGEFNLFVNFHEANIGTCGVNVTSTGMHFYWDRDFVDSLEPKEANFLLIHEDCHLLFDHIKRTVGYDQKLSNVAQDMIINQIIHDDIMKSSSLKGFVEIPKSHDEYLKLPDGTFVLDKKGKQIKNPNYGRNTAMFVPKKYKGQLVFEELYEWLLEELQKYKNRQKSQGNQSDKNSKGQGQGNQQQQKGNQGQGNQQDPNGEGQPNGQGQGGSDQQDDQGDNGGEGQQNNQDGKGKGKGNIPNSCGEKGDEPDYGNYGQNDLDMSHLDKIFENLENSKGETLDRHLTDEVPEELRKEIVRDIMENLKSRGFESGEMESILQKLRKSKKDYLKKIKRVITNEIFGTIKEKTITRPNRRCIQGLKGKKKFQNCVNAILDTSGSMGGEFEKVLSYIFQNDVNINLIQVDTRIQDVVTIKNKKELEKMKIKGHGGTVIQPGLDYITDKKNGLNKYNTIILTDGCTDSLNFKGIKGKTLILSTSSECPIAYNNGRLKQIIIEKDN